MATIVDLIASRRKSIANVEAQVAEFESRIGTIGAASAPGIALAGVVKVHKQRLAKLREELAAFEQLIGPSPNQITIPGTDKPVGEPPAPGPVAGKANQGPTKR